MGNQQQCFCIKGETEEEIISRIIQSMRINEISINTVYEDFSNCISNNELVEESLRLFILKMIGNDRYQNAQKDFFTHIYLHYKKDNRNVRVIGSFICFLGKGSVSEKVDVLYKHLKKYYTDLEQAVNEIIYDIIYVNTKIFELTLRGYIGPEGESNLNELWKEGRILNLSNYFRNDFQSYKQEKVNENKDDVVKKYLEIKFEELQGENIRNVMYEQFMKDRVKETN
jgi:hypothetical protein